MKRLQHRCYGFTLVELLVVISLAAVISAVGVAGFVTYSQTQTVSAAVSSVSSTLQNARSRALSQVVPPSCTLQSYKVRITPPTTYQLIAQCGGADTIIQTKTLPSQVTFSSAATTVVFPLLNGTVTGGTITITGFGQSKNIVVDSGGRITN